jgi:hypothetical protein
VGIGDPTPDYKLEVLDTSTQFTITNTDTVDYTEFFVDSNGDIEIYPSGGDTVLSGDLTIESVANNQVPVVYTSSGTPLPVGGADLGGFYGRSIYVSGRYAYVGKQGAAGTCSGTTLTGCEFSIWDISNPANPIAVGGADLEGDDINGLYVSGRYAYLSKDANAGTCSGTTLTGCEFSIWDISDPSNPTAVSGVDLADEHGFYIHISGRYAYIGKNSNGGTCSGTTLTGCEFSIYDISDPADPQAVGGIDTIGYSWSIYISGRYAYVGRQANAGTCSGTTLTGCELSIYDISDPSNPIGVGGIDSADEYVLSVYVSGSYAYIAKGANAGTCSGTTLTGCEFSIYDVSDPSNPTAVAGVDNGDVAGQNVYVSGRYAYVSKGSNAGTCSGTTLTGCELAIYDIINPYNPKPIGGVDTSDESVVGDNGIHINGRYAYITKLENPGTCSGTTLTGCEFSIYDIGGIETPGLMAHSLEAGNLQVKNDIIAGGDLNITGGINVGEGGIYTTGALGVYNKASIFGNPRSTDTNPILEITSDGLGAPFAISSLTTTTGDWFIVDSSGNIGIGDTTPDAMLEIATSSTSPNYFMISEDDDGDGNIMIVDSSGNVGIGTAVPEGLLHVSGGVMVLDNNQQFTWKDAAGDLGDVRIIGDSNDDMIFTVSNNRFFRFQDEYGYETVRIKDGGDSTTLTVLGNTSSIGILDTDPDAALEITTILLGQTYLMVSSKPSTDGDIFIIDSNGDVGIGEIAPEYKLEVLDSTTQLLLTYSDGIDTEFYVDANGDLTIGPSGGNVTFAVTGGSYAFPSAGPSDNQIMKYDAGTGLLA